MVIESTDVLFNFWNELTKFFKPVVSLFNHPNLASNQNSENNGTELVDETNSRHWNALFSWLEQHVPRTIPPLAVVSSGFRGPVCCADCVVSWHSRMARRVSTHELPVSNGEKGMKLSASNHSWLPLLYTGRWRRFREKWAASNGRDLFPDVVPTGSSSWAMELAPAPRGSFPLSHFPFRFFSYFHFSFKIYNRLWSIKLGQPVPHETISFDWGWPANRVG